LATGSQTWACRYSKSPPSSAPVRRQVFPRSSSMQNLVPKLTTWTSPFTQPQQLRLQSALQLPYPWIQSTPGTLRRRLPLDHPLIVQQRLPPLLMMMSASSVGSGSAPPMRLCLLRSTASQSLHAPSQCFQSLTLGLASALKESCGESIQWRTVSGPGSLVAQGHGCILGNVATHELVSSISLAWVGI
jgi:hypothetical protein